MKTKPIVLIIAFNFFIFLSFGVITNIFAQSTENGKFVLYKYQRAIGTEIYEIKPKDNALELNAKFSLSFIGTLGGAISVETTLKVDKDNYAPQKFVTKGKTSTRTTVDATVEISGDTATIQNNSQTETKKISDKHFAILQPAPISPQMMLFRFWKKNKIKQGIPLLPGGTANIEFLGKDKITVKGKKQTLERYSIEGVMWGRETVWFDKSGNLIALIAADAEMDRFEAVREGFEDSLSYFVRKAAEDSVKHLQNLSKQIKPINEGKYAIVGGLLVGGKDFTTIPDSVIIIENGKILSVGKRQDVKIPKGIKIVDAKGKTILPGLFDMHAHASQAEWFPASLAAGITTMRDAANELEFIVPIRDAIKNGKITVAPRLLLAGYIDSGENSVGKMKAETAVEARAIVNQYNRAGFEQIKIYQSLKPELVKVVADEAHKLGMTVTGHIPNGLNIFKAIDDGYDQINHLGFVMRIMSPRDFNPKTDGRRNFDPTTKAAQDGFRFLLDNKIVVEPTMARGEVGSKILGDSFAETEPGAKKLPFEFETLIRSMGVSAENAQRRQRGRAFALTILKALHNARVPLIVGTDLVIPGHTEYREIELFVKAGLSPTDAIKSATIVPAKAMNFDKQLGTIEQGKIADLILLDANPLESIGNIRKVKFVIKDGRMFDTAPLWRSVNFQP